MRRRPVVLAASLLVVGLVGCSRTDDSGRYCQVVVETHERALMAKTENGSGVARSATAVGSIQAQRIAASPDEIREEWATVIEGPAMESDGLDGARKEAAYRAAVATIEQYDQGKCAVAPDVAPPDSVTAR